MPSRSYNLGEMKYDYTGKERDNETNYDYFGARYYDSRIARWGQMEPLLSINLNVSPYIYCNSNPIIFTDIQGLDEFFYTEGSLSPIRYPKPGEDVYYYEHPEGNFEVTEATGIYSKLLGKSFYKASSSSTARFYKTESLGGGKRYSYKHIEVNFEDKTSVSLVTEAVNKKLYMSIFEIADHSKDLGRFDYKQYLAVTSLYLFGNLVYNQQEAGNILWGMTIAFYDVPLWEANIGANLFKLKKELELDEINEEIAYERGYQYFKQQPFITR